MTSEYKNRLLLNSKETASLLGISVPALRVRCCRRQIPFKKWGGKLVFLPKELEDFLNFLSMKTSVSELKKIIKQKKGELK